MRVGHVCDDEQMMGRGTSRELMRIFGIRIGVDISWFFVLFLAIFVLQGSFKQTIDGSDTTAYMAAVGAAFLFFGSIVLHELGHALAARREGIGVTGIDLFFFGGLMQDEPRDRIARCRVPRRHRGTAGHVPDRRRDVRRGHGDRRIAQ